MIKKSLEKEMQKDIEKRKGEFHPFLKIELLEAIQSDIASFIKKSNLELNNDMAKYLKDCISSSKVKLLAIEVNYKKDMRWRKNALSTIVHLSILNRN